MPRIARIALTPVKGFALEQCDEVELGPGGVVENRRFMLVDGKGERLRSSLTAWPAAVSARWDRDVERLLLRFPDGELEGSALATGESLVCDYHGTAVPVRVVEGAWNERLSALAGHAVRLVRTERPHSLHGEPLTLLSEASLAALEETAGRPLGEARFRLLFALSGCGPYEEDTWDGRSFAVGGARIRVGGPVVRCAVTTRDPETQQRDFDTLRLLQETRGEIHFGVYARVERPGWVRTGDELRPL